MENRKLLTTLLMASVILNVALLLFIVPQFLFPNVTHQPPEVDSQLQVPGPKPADTLAAPTNVVARLESAKAQANRALDQLKNATTNNKGGMVEKARSDITEVMAHLDAAIDFANNHPDLNTMPAAGVALQLEPTPSVIRSVGPNLHDAIDTLHLAARQLEDLPNSDFGGARDKYTSSLQQAVTDLVTGIRIAQQSQRGRGGDAATDWKN